MEAIASRVIPPTNKRKALTLVIAFCLSLSACASTPNPTPVYNDVETSLVDFIDEIEAGLWVPVLAEGVIVENPKKELANMKRRRLERLKQNLKTVRAAKGKK